MALKVFWVFGGRFVDFCLFVCVFTSRFQGKLSFRRAQLAFQV